MTADRLFLDSVELRHVAARVRGNERVARDVGTDLPGAQIEFPTGDPVRAHRHFMSAFTEFTATWGREMELVADAASEFAAGLTLTADRLLEKDRQDKEKAGSIGPR